MMANTNTEAPYDGVNPNEDHSMNMMHKHESGPGNMQGAPEETKDNRMPVLIDFTGE
jgi:hypothetical protein